MSDARIAAVNNALSSIQRDLRGMDANLPDPVDQRRLQVRCAEELRNLADLLDDSGNLTE